MKAVDTSVLYALFNTGDQRHQEAIALVHAHAPLVVPPSVLQELLDLVRHRHGRHKAQGIAAWLNGAPQFLLDACNLDEAHANAVAEFLTDRPRHSGRVHLSFADIACITYARCNRLSLLTRDPNQGELAAELGIPTH